VPCHVGGHHEKVVGHSKKNFSGASRRKLCPSTCKLLPAPLDAKVIEYKTN